MPKTRADDEPLERPQPPQPRPPGTEGSDVDDPKPHKTCSDGTKGARRAKDEVA